MKYRKQAIVLLYDYISLVMLFFLFTFFALMLHRCYTILEFNYFVIWAPFVFWILAYFCYRSLLILPQMKKRPYLPMFAGLLLLFVVCVACAVLIISGLLDIGVLGRDTLQAFFKLQASFTRGAKYTFTDVAYPLAAGSFVISALFVFCDRVRLGQINVVSSLLLLFVLWSFRPDDVVKIYTLLIFFVLFFYYGITIYVRWADSIKSADKAADKTAGNIKDGTEKQTPVNLDKNTILVLCAIITFLCIFSGFMISDSLKSKSIFAFLNKRSNLFHFSVIGFSTKDSILGGKLKRDEAVACLVWSDRPYYLRADVKDYYTGTMWLKSKKPVFIEDEKDLAEKERYFSGRADFEKTKLKVQPGTFKMHIYLTPLYTFNTRGKQKSVHTGSSVFQTFNSGKISKPYDIGFFAHRYSLSLMEQIVLPGEEKRTLYKHYLQLPESITDRTKELALSLTGTKTAPFEKIRAVKSFLQKNYTYSLDVPAIPEEQEFVDYFLFSGKTGYCSYYASAATVLLRLSGIPARYVTGFAMTGERNDGGAFVVRNSNAHAWTEVLVDPEHDVWVTLDCVPLYIPAIDYYSMYAYRQFQNGPDNGQNVTGLNEGESVKEDIEKPDPVKKGILYFLAAAGGIILLVLICLLFFIFKQYRKKKRVLHAESVIPFYFFIKKRLISAGCYTAGSMCESEFIEQIENPDLKKRLLGLVEWYYSEFFGTARVNRQIEEKRTLYYLTENYVRQRQAFFPFYLKKLFYN